MSLQRDNQAGGEAFSVANLLPESVYGGNPMFMRSKSTQLKAGVAGAALATVLLLASPLVAAKPDAKSGEQWSEWQSLGGGYVGRRKVPPKADLPKSERRLDTTQVRGKSKLDTTRVRGKSKPDTTRVRGKSKPDTNRVRGKSKNVKLESTSTTTYEAEVSSFTTLSATTLAATAETANIDALWLRTLGAGLYGAPIADLAAQLGETTSALRIKAADGQLSLTNGGEPLSWHFDEESENFLFAVEAYDTFHTDMNASRFLADASAARPMVVAAGPSTGATGIESPFTETLSFEEEPDFYYSTWTVASEPDADYWFWDYLYGGTKDAIVVELNIPNPVASGVAQLRVTLRGWTNLVAGNEHQVYAELNGASVGSPIIWDGFDEAVLVADFDQSLLNSGSNTLTLRNVYTAGTTPGQWLDRVEVDYQRQPAAVDGALRLRGVQAGVQTVTGFSSSEIVVIESPSGTAVMREDVRVDQDGFGSWTVTFETTGGDDYLVSERGAIGAPDLAPDTASSLSDSSNSADYLILAPREFAGTAEALAALRQGRFTAVKIVWLDEIYDEFNDGRMDPAAIGRFMDHVAGAWRMSPSNVTLIGKGSLDCKDRMGYSDCFLPIVMTDNPWALAPSDERLLAGESNAAFAIGRLPITNDAEGIAYVDKLSAYESSIAGSERLTAVLVADNSDNAGDFQANSDMTAAQLLGLGFDTVSKLYHPQDAVRLGFIDSATWETNYVAYDGHGSATQVGNGSENFINAADAVALSNTAYPVFTALTCASGDDTLPGTRSLAGALVLNPAGGAIASLAPTGASLDADAQQLSNAFVDSLYGGSATTIGEAVHAAKTQTSGSISAFMPRMYSVTGDPGVLAR